MQIFNPYILFKYDATYYKVYQPPTSNLFLIQEKYFLSNGLKAMITKTISNQLIANKQHDLAENRYNFSPRHLQLITTIRITRFKHLLQIS